MPPKSEAAARKYGLSPNTKVATYAVLIALQAVAAGLVAANSGGGQDGASAVIFLALFVTIAAGVRELIRELTGPDHKVGREVRRSSHLLQFLLDSFPTLMSTFTSALTMTDKVEQQRCAILLRERVMTELGKLFPQTKLRVAYFQRRNECFVAEAPSLGWDVEPQCPGNGLEVVILKVLEGSGGVHVPDVKLERSAYALAFRISDTCESFFVAPIRLPRGVGGFLYLESDEGNALDEQATRIALALSQLLSAVESTASAGQAGPDRTPPHGAI